MPAFLIFIESNHCVVRLFVYSLVNNPASALRANIYIQLFTLDFNFPTHADRVLFIEITVFKRVLTTITIAPNMYPEAFYCVSDAFSRVNSRRLV
jgi:hypothetical protein